MNLATAFAAEAIQQFGQGALCAVLAIDEWGDDR
jgi:hypothetical protein